MAFANVAASQTDSSIVSAVAGKSITVLGFGLVAGATATTVTFNSKGAGAGTAISALYALPISGVCVFPVSAPSSGYWFKTNVGEALTVTTGAGATTGIEIVIQIV